MAITQIWVMYIAQTPKPCYYPHMDPRFSAYNTHINEPDRYWENDSQLRNLKNQPFIYEHPLIQELPRDTPGIYTVGGGRQIGKTTLLKQWIASLMASGVPPSTIFFYTGELINDHHELVSLLEDITNANHKQQRLYLIIDEITYVKDWEKGIKFAADAGMLENCIVVLTGSDLTLMQSARMSFPGRRGTADEVDFHIYALSFREFLVMKQSIPEIETYINSDALPNPEVMQTLYAEFQNYQIHGGYLTAINDIARDGAIKKATLKTYSDWIRGDVLKRGKQELYLKEILKGILKHYNKQVTWHNLADEMSIDSHKTVSDYCDLLATMDALYIQSALMEDKLTAAPKKARKLTFTDPFIYHAIKHWLKPSADPNEQIQNDVTDAVISSDLVEAIAINHYQRLLPTYYIKSEGEVDIAYIEDEKFWPIEIKWRNQIRPKDIKQIKKYKRSKIYSKISDYRHLDGVPMQPLPLALLRLKKGAS